MNFCLGVPQFIAFSFSICFCSLDIASCSSRLLNFQSCFLIHIILFSDCLTGVLSPCIESSQFIQSHHCFLFMLSFLMPFLLHLLLCFLNHYVVLCCCCCLCANLLLHPAPKLVVLFFLFGASSPTHSGQSIETTHQVCAAQPHGAVILQPSCTGNPDNAHNTPCLTRNQQGFTATT